MVFLRIIRSPLKSKTAMSIALLIGAFLAAPISSSHADVLFNQEFKFFKVRGENSQQIFRDFQKRSPIKAKGKFDATLGVAAIKLTPEVEYEIKGKRCHVQDARVTADVVIHLPDWVNYQEADNIGKLSWDKLFSDIKAHELQHAAIAKDYANRIQKRIKRSFSRGNCDKLEAVLKKTSSRLLAKHDRAQRRFDEKEYGRLFKRK